MARLRRPFGVWLAFALVVGGMAHDRPAPPASIGAALGLSTGAAASAGLERRQADAIAALTERCMTERGAPFGIDPEPPPLIPDADLGPIAWAERWGFGISTSLDAATPPPVRDPTAERLAALAPAERVRVTAALYGSSDGRAGCRAAATTSVMGLRDRLLAPLAADLAVMRAQVAADPRAAIAADAWRSCLSAAGVAVTERATAVSGLMASFANRAGALAASGGRAAGTLASLQGEERQVATVVARCEGGYVAAVAPIEQEAEARFVAAHMQSLARIGVEIRAAEAAWPSG